MSLSEFFHMGGYAFYVWMSYGLALVVLVANVVRPWRRERQLLDEMAAKAARGKQAQPRHTVSQ